MGTVKALPRPQATVHGSESGGLNHLYPTGRAVVHSPTVRYVGWRLAANRRLRPMRRGSRLQLGSRQATTKLDFAGRW